MIKSLIAKFLLPYERYLWIIGVVLLVIGVGVYNHHERGIGRAETKAADAAARVDEHKKIAAEETRLQKVADAAEEARDAKAKELKEYVDTHPVGVVRLRSRACDQPAGAGQTAGANSPDAAGNSGPDPVPTVLDGGAGPNIGGDIDAILSAAERMGLSLRQYQAQPVPKSVN